MNSDSGIKEWLTTERAGGNLCSCGDFACHNAIHCKRCGTEFKPVVSTTRENLIRRKSFYKGREYSVRWFVALDSRLLRDVHDVNEYDEVIRHRVENLLWPGDSIT